MSAFAETLAFGDKEIHKYSKRTYTSIPDLNTIISFFISNLKLPVLRLAFSAPAQPICLPHHAPPGYPGYPDPWLVPIPEPAYSLPSSRLCFYIFHPSKAWLSSSPTSNTTPSGNEVFSDLPCQHQPPPSPSAF